jgi:hypothetical protein
MGVKELHFAGLGVAGLHGRLSDQRATAALERPHEEAEISVVWGRERS